MKNQILVGVLLIFAYSTQAQNSFPNNLISVNAFRNPSIGLEYQRKQLSIHGGYYLTNFESGVTTKFIRAGVTYWVLPLGKKDIPSSFYVSASYLRGLSRAYKYDNAVGVEVGFRWYIWKGLNLRIGVIALAAEGKEVKINPTPSISYSFKF
jgi:hypothetical protein